MAQSQALHKTFQVLETVQLFELYDLTKDKDELLAYLMKNGLLGDFHGECSTCHEGTVLFKERWFSPLQRNTVFFILISFKVSAFI